MNAYAGIDVAIAKKKWLPVSVCVWRDGRLEPLPLNGLRVTVRHDKKRAEPCLPLDGGGSERDEAAVASIQTAEFSMTGSYPRFGVSQRSASVTLTPFRRA